MNEHTHIHWRGGGETAERGENYWRKDRQEKTEETAGTQSPCYNLRLLCDWWQVFTRQMHTCWFSATAWCHSHWYVERALLWQTTREQRTIEVSLSVVNLPFRSETGNHQPSISHLTLSAVNNRTEIFYFSKEAQQLLLIFLFFKPQNFSKGEKRLSGFILRVCFPNKQTNIKLKNRIKNIKTFRCS